MSHGEPQLPEHAIALVGMAGRFPGARDVAALWANMLAGREGAQAIPDAELDPAVSDEARQDPSYVAFRGVMPDYDRFDAAFFGVSPMEACPLGGLSKSFMSCTARSVCRRIRLACS